MCTPSDSATEGFQTSRPVKRRQGAGTAQVESCGRRGHVADSSTCTAQGSCDDCTKRAALTRLQASAAPSTSGCPLPLVEAGTEGVNEERHVVRRTERQGTSRGVVLKVCNIHVQVQQEPPAISHATVLPSNGSISLCSACNAIATAPDCASAAVLSEAATP